MRTGDLPCQHCKGIALDGANYACPNCGRSGADKAYETLRRSGLLTVGQRRSRKRRKAVASFLAGLGALLAFVGISGQEMALPVLGIAMMTLAIVLLIGSDVMKWLVEFVNSRAGRVTVWVSLAAIAALILIPVVQSA